MTKKASKYYIENKIKKILKENLKTKYRNLSEF